MNYNRLATLLPIASV